MSRPADSIQAVIFDWGGVLMRTLDYRPRYRWDARLGLPPGGVERVVHGCEAWSRAQRGEISVEDYWAEVTRHLSLSPDDLAALQRDFYSGDSLDLELVALIRDVRGRGMMTGILSNNTPDLLDTIRALQIDTLFDSCVISAQIGVMKPDPRAYLAMLESLDVAPQHALLVDDFAHNIEGARTIGMSAIHFVPGMDLRAALDGWIGSAA